MDKTFYHEALNSLTERFIYLSAPCTIFLAAPTAYSQAMGTGRLPEEKAFVVQPRGSSGEAPVPGAGEAGWGAPSCLGMPVLPETGQGSAEEPWNPPASPHPGTGGAHGLHRAAGWHLGTCCLRSRASGTQWEEVPDSVLASWARLSSDASLNLCFWLCHEEGFCASSVVCFSPITDWPAHQWAALHVTFHSRTLICFFLSWYFGCISFFCPAIVKEIMVALSNTLVCGRYVAHVNIKSLNVIEKSTNERCLYRNHFALWAFLTSN